MLYTLKCDSKISFDFVLAYYILRYLKNLFEHTHVTSTTWWKQILLSFYLQITTYISIPPCPCFDWCVFFSFWKKNLFWWRFCAYIMEIILYYLQIVFFKVFRWYLQYNLNTRRKYYIVFCIYCETFYWWIVYRKIQVLELPMRIGEMGLRREYILAKNEEKPCCSYFFHLTHFWRILGTRQFKFGWLIRH